MNTFWQQITIQEDAFDLGFEEKNIRQHAQNSGALVAFQGMVRELDCARDNAPIQSLYLQHYPEVTESEIACIVSQATQRWSLSAVRVIHRVGELQAQDVIVLVIACAQHRKDAFAAAEFIMDYLKTQAPFWKRENHTNGEKHWVTAKNTDTQAAQRWNEI